MNYSLANKCLDRTKEKIKSTYNEKVVNDFGTFGGLYRLGQYKDPVLVSSIDGVGTTLCKELASTYHDVFNLVDALDNNAADVEAIVGPVATASLTAFFTDPANVADIAEMMKVGVTFKDEVRTGVLSGKTFCITGELSRPRDVMTKWIEDQGGTVKGSVSKKVGWLVVGAGAGKGKTDGATKLGTKCISENELYEICGIVPPQIEINVEDNY